MLYNVCDMVIFLKKSPRTQLKLSSGIGKAGLFQSRNSMNQGGKETQIYVQ